MSVVNLLLYVALVLVGARATWAGIRGLRGEVRVRYDWPLNLLVERRPIEEQHQINQYVLKFGSISRVAFGLVLMGMGIYFLWLEFAKLIP